MKRFVLLFAIMLMLAACGSTSTETAVSVTEEPTKAETAVSENNSVAEDAPEETAAESAAPSTELAAIANFPATNVDEASIVRERDWTIGADDPLVTIIEYGDFQ